MAHDSLLATPWWVNLLILTPIVPYLLSKRGKVLLGNRRLLVSAVFGVAFGFVEAAVVVYLRASAGLLPGQQGLAANGFPGHLLRIEVFREAATMVMLVAVAMLAARGIRERIVAFLWTFAFWDLAYYLWLCVLIGWPNSLINPDLLFLIPVPWIAQVWFPVLVSSLTVVVIWFCSRKPIGVRIRVDNTP